MNKDIYLSKRDMPFNVLAFLILLVSSIWFVVDDKTIYISVLSTSLTFLLCAKFWRTLPLLILFAYLSMYTYESTKFFFTGILLSANRSFQTPEIVNKLLVLNNIFVFSLGVVIPSNVHKIAIDLKRFQFESKYLFWLLVVVGLFMIQFGIRGESLLSGKGYGGGASQKSTMHEYFIMIYFIMLMIFPRKSFVARFVLNALFVIFCIKTLIYGGRIEVLEIALLFFYFFWILQKKINKPLFYLMVTFALYFNSIFSMVRARPLMLVQGDFATIFNPVELFRENPHKLPYLLSNEGDVLQAGARILGLIEEGYLSTEKRLLSFGTYIFSFLLPSSFWPDFTDLSKYKKELYGAGGGGLLPAFFYAWLGYAGPFIVGAFIGFMLRKLYKSKNVFYKIYGTCLLFTMPRWYAYSPTFLVKYIFYAVIIYALLKITYNTFLRKKVALLQTQ